METSEKFEAWALVEVMGHSRYAGRVTEQAIGGCAFVRVDVPQCGERAAFTKLLGAGSIFAITPVTEEIARAMAAQYRNEPVSVYDLPESLRQPALTSPAESGGIMPDWDDENEEDDEPC